MSSEESQRRIEVEDGEAIESGVEESSGFKIRLELETLIYSTTNELDLLTQKICIGAFLWLPLAIAVVAFAFVGAGIVHLLMIGGGLVAFLALDAVQYLTLRRTLHAAAQVLREFKLPAEAEEVFYPEATVVELGP